MKLMQHSWYLAYRNLRNLSRQPWYIAFTLIQPIIWLLLFGELFKSVVEIPGFGAASYIDFLTPGVVVMNAMFSGGWSGMSTVQDLERGFMDRLLVSPANRAAIIVGRLMQLAVVITIQGSIIIIVGLIRGATFSTGIVGVILLILSAILLALPFAALSNGMALLMRHEESVIGANNFILLPLTFLSSTFMAQSLMPGWMQEIAKFNPVNWAVSAGRTAVGPNPDWGFVFQRLGWLLILLVVSAWLATRAFRTYQRSL